MSLFFEAFEENRCCLCGAKNNLTGEHKIKASALRHIFKNNTPMFIGSFDGINKHILAQSPKSKAFHFSAKICANCNNSRTQNSDREFDNFNNIIQSLADQDLDPSLIFDLPRYSLNSDHYLNLFRYFAKILACHIAESQGPRFIPVCDFSIGISNKNIISLSIDTDTSHPIFQTNIPISDFAAHGGLQVIFNYKFHDSIKFISSITLGKITYSFSINIFNKVSYELYKDHYSFWEKCHSAYKKVLSTNAPDI